MKALVKSLLHYDRWRDSAPGEVLLYLYSPAAGRSRAAERRFYRSLSPWPRRWQLVFDVGANAGAKALVFRRLAKRVLCIEPDATSAAMLQKRFASDPSIEILHAGISDHEGREQFSVLESGSPYNTFSRKWAQARMDASRADAKTEVSVEVTTIDRLIERYGVPDYVKIDVEGYEETVLRGLSRPVPLLSFEANLPIFESETLACVRRLAMLDPSGSFNCAVAEPPHEFRLSSWIGADAMIRELERRNSPFMEIFWRSSR